MGKPLEQRKFDDIGKSNPGDLALVVVVNVAWKRFKPAKAVVMNEKAADLVVGGACNRQHGWQNLCRGLAFDQICSRAGFWPSIGIQPIVTNVALQDGKLGANAVQFQDVPMCLRAQAQVQRHQKVVVKNDIVFQHKRDAGPRFKKFPPHAKM